MPTRSWDIRYQSRKLSEIAPKLGRFWPSQILGRRPSKSYTHVMTPAWRHVVRKMFSRDTPTGPKVIEVHTLNFKPNFTFSRFHFFRYVDSFRRYSRSKSKVVKNRAEFKTMFCSSKFSGAGLPKIVRTLSPLPRGTSPGKVSSGYFH